MENEETNPMHNLSAGDILMDVNDGSKWRFITYGVDMITVAAGSPMPEGRTVKERILVVRLNGDGTAKSDPEMADTSGFRKLN